MFQVYLTGSVNEGLQFSEITKCFEIHINVFKNGMAIVSFILILVIDKDFFKEVLNRTSESAEQASASLHIPSV